jgi:Domain of unknown function (DUF397)
MWIKSSFCRTGCCVEVEYRKSSFCADCNCVEVSYQKSSSCTRGDCVEVGHGEDKFFVRDSKNPNGPVLEFSRDEWDAFLAGVRNSEFD